MMDRLLVTSAIILNGRGQLLAGKRRGCNDGYDGLYCTLGGKVEPSEQIPNSLIRECCEEADIQIRRMRFIGFNEPAGFLLFYYLVLDYERKIRLMEPTKCEGWEWVDWSVPMTPGLELFKARNWIQFKTDEFAYRSAIREMDRMRVKQWMQEQSFGMHRMIAAANMECHTDFDHSELTSIASEIR